MILDRIQISRIVKRSHSRENDERYVVIWVKKEVDEIVINQSKYANVSNSVFFLRPNYQWHISLDDNSNTSGFILYIPKVLLEDPTFKNLHITEVRLFCDGEVPRIILAPGIETRIQSILEMLDELISTNLKHREDAIVALLKTFFIYCDGKCNIKSVITDNNSKTALVYKYKKILDQHHLQYHKVADYAQLLNVSDKYLNECVNDVLGVNAKSLISEQLAMRSRHAIKFSDKSVKEIAFELGFSSPEYFSAFFKKHYGHSPLEFRKL
jgi:AraC-like DNA-binding protein